MTRAIAKAATTPHWHDQQEPLLADNREQIIDPRTAYQIVSMLQGVVQRGTAAYSVGAQIGKPLAGKTGTSQDAQSVWFIGFSPDLAAGVYVGFDNPRTLGPKEQGATVAAPIFRDFMKERAGRRAAHAVPRRAGHRGSADRLEERQSGARRHAGRHHGSLQGRHRAGRSQCAGRRAADGQGAPAPAVGQCPPAPAGPTRQALRPRCREGTGGIY